MSHNRDFAHVLPTLATPSAPAEPVHHPRNSRNDEGGLVVQSI